MEPGRLTQAPRPIFASSIPTVFGFSKTQPPMVSWPMSSIAGTVSPCLERITFNLIQIEGDPRQASRGLCCVSPLIR